MRQTLQLFTAFGLAALLAITVIGCEEPKESPGEKLKEAGEEVKEGLENNDDVSDTLDKAVDELQDPEDRTPGENLEEGAEELKEKVSGEDENP